MKSFLTDIFPDSPMPEKRPEVYRSCALRIGTYIVIQNVLKEHKLFGMLEKHLGKTMGHGGWIIT